MTHSAGRTAMRTEADIRAAIAGLAQRAPDAGAVLSELREAGLGRQRGTWRPPGRRWSGRRPSLLVGAAAAVTVTALVAVLTPGSSPAPGSIPARMAGLVPSPAALAPPGSLRPGPAPGHAPSASSVAKAMLAAVNVTAGDLVYQTSAGYTKGVYEQITRTWNWPALPSPGQTEYAREFLSELPVGPAKGSAGVEPMEDDQYVTVVPPPSRFGRNTYAHLTMVCYGGDGQTGCGWGPYETPAGTWSEHAGKLGYQDFSPYPHGTDLARQIGRGDWRIVGHTRLRGQPAIKLSETRNGEFDGHPVYLWVSTVTFLPLRMYWQEGTGLEIDNWYYLPPSKANLAKLRVPVPPGYPRSG